MSTPISSWNPILHPIDTLRSKEASLAERVMAVVASIFTLIFLGIPWIITSCIFPSSALQKPDTATPFSTDPPPPYPDTPPEEPPPLPHPPMLADTDSESGTPPPSPVSTEDPEPTSTTSEAPVWKPEALTFVQGLRQAFFDGAPNSLIALRFYLKDSLENPTHPVAKLLASCGQITSIPERSAHAQALFSYITTTCVPTAHVEFPAPPKAEKIRLMRAYTEETLASSQGKLQQVCTMTRLDPRGTGVEGLIRGTTSSSDSIFLVASHYHCEESVSRACERKIGDDFSNEGSQAASARRTHPLLSELVHTFLGHCGFNMLAGALDASAFTPSLPLPPSTPENSPDRFLMFNGVLSPPFRTSSSENPAILMDNPTICTRLAEDLVAHSDKIRFLYYEAERRSPQGGSINPGFLYHSAPHFDGAHPQCQLDKVSDSGRAKGLEAKQLLTRMNALLTFSADFAFVLAKARTNGGKPIRLLVPAFGGGAWNNAIGDLWWAFRRAFHHYATRLPENLSIHFYEFPPRDYSGADSPSLLTFTQQAGIPSLTEAALCGR